jgi:hypothetical protein
MPHVTPNAKCGAVSSGEAQLLLTGETSARRLSLMVESNVIERSIESAAAA